jgi:hypothetical protein
VIKTKIGISRLGQETGLIVIRGKNVLGHFVGWGNWRHAVFLASGVDIGSRNDQILTEMVIGTNSADPRLWCNTVSFLMAKDRVSPMYAFAGALAAAHGKVYGEWPVVIAAELLVKLEKCLERKDSLTDWVQQHHKYLSAVLRPVKEIDERVPFYLHILKTYGMTNLKYVKLAFLLEKAVHKSNAGTIEYKINAVGCIAAITLDMGIPPNALAPVLATWLHNGTLAAYVAGREATDEDTISYSKIMDEA